MSGREEEGLKIPTTRDPSPNYLNTVEALLKDTPEIRTPLYIVLYYVPNMLS